MAELHGGNIYDNNIKADFSVNINPLGCPPEIKKAMAAAVKNIDTYPELSQQRIISAISKTERLPEECVVCGNGASELFLAVVNAFKPQRVLLVQPCFGGYGHALNALDNCEIDNYFLSEADDYILTEDFLSAVRPEYDMLFLCSPNNPTGRVISRELMVRVLKRCSELNVRILLDECFSELTSAVDSMREYVQHCPQLIIVKAYTKALAVPGIRIGYALSAAENIQSIRRQLPEWNVSVLAEAVVLSGTELISDGVYIRSALEIIETEKRYLTAGLEAMGVKCFDTDSNFMLIQSDRDLYSLLLSKGILIRSCSSFIGLPDGCFRIAIKQHTENELLLSTLKEVL